MSVRVFVKKRRASSDEHRKMALWSRHRRVRDKHTQLSCERNVFQLAGELQLHVQFRVRRKWDILHRSNSASHVFPCSNSLFSDDYLTLAAASALLPISYSPVSGSVVPSNISLLRVTFDNKIAFGNGSLIIQRVNGNSKLFLLCSYCSGLIS